MKPMASRFSMGAADQAEAGLEAARWRAVLAATLASCIPLTVDDTLTPVRALVLLALPVIVLSPTWWVLVILAALWRW